MGNKILCVDDSNTIRMLVKKALEPAGFTVLEAENGKKALALLKTETADLCIVDVNMPEMNGFEFVENIKKDERMRQKPVVFLTTESSADKKGMGKDLGVNGWIVKPFDPTSLVKVVNMLLG